jgi:hypothetical protein
MLEIGPSDGAGDVHLEPVGVRAVGHNQREQFGDNIFTLNWLCRWTTAVHHSNYTRPKVANDDRRAISSLEERRIIALLK